MHRDTRDDDIMSSSFAGLPFAAITIGEAARRIAARDPGAPFEHVVTPNVDHIVRLHDHPQWAELQASYRRAFLCLCDSRVLARLAWLRGIRLQVVTGSDLIARLLPVALAPGDALTLIGGDDETLARLRALCPGVAIVQHQPPMGLLANEAAMAACIRFVEANPARFVLLAVGSPQQELLAQRIRVSGQATGTGLCIGVSIEFLTGKLSRAPFWMRQLALEWLYRLIQNPAGLWRRYLVRGPRIFRIAMRRRRA